MMSPSNKRYGFNYFILFESYIMMLSDMFQKQTEADLKSLRDMVVFAFCMGNAIFILIVFLLQLKKEDLHFKWPFNADNTIIFHEDVFEITIQREYLQLEPIGFMFVIFFGVVLAIQFVAMLIHRFKTVSQILASTEIDWYFSKRAKDVNAAAEIKENGVQLAKRLQRPTPPKEGDLDETSQAGKKSVRRDTIHRNIIQKQSVQVDESNLERNFLRKWNSDKELDLGNGMSGKSKSLLEQRRSIARASQNQGGGQNNRSNPVRTRNDVYASQRQRPLPEIPVNEIPHTSTSPPTFRSSFTANWVNSTTPEIEEEQPFDTSPPPDYVSRYGQDNYAYDTYGDEFDDEAEVIELQEREGPVRRFSKNKK